MVAKVNVDAVSISIAYPFLTFSDLTCCLKDLGVTVFDRTWK